jgi:hypothetical protein
VIATPSGVSPTFNVAVTLFVAVSITVNVVGVPVRPTYVNGAAPAILTSTKIIAIETVPLQKILSNDTIE